MSHQITVKEREGNGEIKAPSQCTVLVESVTDLALCF